MQRLIAASLLVGSSLGFAACSMEANDGPVGETGTAISGGSNTATISKVCPADMQPFRGGAPPAGVTIVDIPHDAHDAMLAARSFFPSRRSSALGGPNRPFAAGSYLAGAESDHLEFNGHSIGVFPDKGALPPIHGVVLHTTNSPGAEAAWDHWRTSGTSAHYIIDAERPNGDVTIYVAVAECHMAYHAPDDQSAGSDFRNQYTIGIEHVGIPYGSSPGGDRASGVPLEDGTHFTSTKAQRRASIALVRDICGRYGLGCEHNTKASAGYSMGGPALFQHRDLTGTQCPGDWPMGMYK